jgi:hypothetical protein
MSRTFARISFQGSSHRQPARKLYSGKRRCRHGGRSDGELHSHGRRIFLFALTASATGCSAADVYRMAGNQLCPQRRTLIARHQRTRVRFPAAGRRKTFSCRRNAGLVSADSLRRDQRRVHHHDNSFASARRSARSILFDFSRWNSRIFSLDECSRPHAGAVKACSAHLGKFPASGFGFCRQLVITAISTPHDRIPRRKRA